jgi:exonuclease III
MPTIHVSWWNLENCFDVENAPDRSDKLQRTLKSELKGWDAQVLDKKLANLSSIINQMNGNTGPDLLGVCEVESRHVLEMLVARLQRKTYAIIHADSKDERGIDVAFIYDTKVFHHVHKKEVFNHFVMKRTATRDIVQATFYTQQGNLPLVVLGNHWPSRSSGELETEPYRIIAAETLAYFHQRIYEALKSDTVAVLAMGDFNDTPHDRSLMEYALSSNSDDTVLNAKERCYFFNLMWGFLANGEGTHYYDGFALLDQIMV